MNFTFESPSAQERAASHPSSAPKLTETNPSLPPCLEQLLASLSQQGVQKLLHG